MLAELPDPDRLVAFDRKVMVTMTENVEPTTRQQLADLVHLLVGSVPAKGRVVAPSGCLPILGMPGRPDPPQGLG